MLYLNDNEEKVIGSFVEVEANFTNKILRLIWNNGSEVVAKYDSFIEDENEGDFETDEYEEYWSFVFLAIVPQTGAPIDVSDDGFFAINYHNFPQKIVCENEIIYEKLQAPS